MEEQRLRLLALIITLLGLSALGWYAWTMNSSLGIEDPLPQDPASSPAANSGHKPTLNPTLNPTPSVGSRISIFGTVVRVETHGKVHFLKLSPAPQYPLVSFETLDVQQQEKVKVTGKVKMYKGSPEVVIEKIAHLG